MAGWERWKLGWQHTFFGLLLAMQLTRPGALPTEDAGGLVLRVALLAALFGWYAWWFGPWRGAESPAVLRYLIGAAVLWVALVAVDPNFWVSGFAVLIPLGMRRPALAALAVATCGGVWLTARAWTQALAWPEVAASVLTIGAAIVFLGYLAALDHEGRRRARLIEELAAAQAELAAAERRAGTLAERQRLAREVHDTLTQGFASVILLLEAERAAGSSRNVDTALRTARENLAESRRLVWALQPAPLAAARLPDAVRELTGRLADEAPVNARTIVTGAPVTLDPATEAQVLRVVQEALTNARRHADATEVVVTMAYLPGELRIDISDDGVGMPARTPPSGMGLRAMRERADDLGATLSVESGAGTTVVLAVPLPAKTGA